MEELPEPVDTESADPEDLALGALLALQARWREAEGRQVTLRALGLELGPQERYLSAVCATHGRFHVLWRAAASADRPERIACPGSAQLRCDDGCAVDFTYEPARPTS